MSQIQPITLGKHTFPINLIQGPLAGISCAPFRYLTWKYSQPAYTCTEMMSCKTILQQNRSVQKRYLTKANGEGPVCFQLSGDDPKELGEATKIVTDHGADLIDLNCGCPVKKIRSKGAGSRLLMEPAKLYALIHAMKQHTHLPVSIKIRVENQHEKSNAEIANVVRDAGADFLVVHGRHWTEHYETPCRYDDIRYFVTELNIPIIGNGDIACTESLKKMFATGCAGVMIGRAGVGQPWLIKKLIAEMSHKNFTPLTASEIAAVFMTHVNQLAELLGNEKFALLQARKFAKYYARQLPDRAAFCAAMNTCEDITTANDVCLRYFE